MTRNKFLSMWAGLLAAVGVGKAQSNTETDYVGPVSVGWAKLTRDQAISPRPVYPPNHCPVCGTKAPRKGGWNWILEKWKADGTKVTYESRQAVVCSTCRVVWVREDLPLRIDGGEGK